MEYRMKKLAIYFLSSLLIMLPGGMILSTSFAETAVKVSQNDLLISNGTYSANENTNVTVQENFLKNIQKYMMGLVGILSVGVFIYIGYSLFTAQGNEEEFKKAWKALIYAAIGLAVMPLAYVAVKIVTGFTF